MEKLKHFKQTYHKNHPESTKDEETRAIIAKIEEYIKDVLPTIITTRSYDINQKALLLLEAGKLYNIVDDYQEIAETFLSKSVKMNPKSADGWHELGKCVMKRQDVEFAQSCFRIALGIERSAEILTSLAISVRLAALKVPEPGQTDLRTQAMDLLIEARRLDNSYGPAHCAFATGLFYCFFDAPKAELHFLDKVIENYQKAVECELSRTDPQVYINMATCLRFMEKYEEALSNIQKAVEYDSRNELKTLEMLNSCSNYLLKFSEAIQKKGKVKAKRLAEMVQSLQKQQADDFHLKIIGTVAHDEPIPVALVGVDSAGEVYGITIYNCLPDFGFVIGDTISVPSPVFRQIENFQVPSDPPVTIESIRWIRVATPTQIKKNGAALPESVLARAVAATQTK
uniref:Tetratricopeptide repeat protein 5 OB fold domain-containing protein n=1 Tax=Caenorhabditis japonica TaxID=281687 RepID=A0A8R1DP98_CAEJA